MFLVCSKSTRGFFPDISNVKVITGRLNTSILKEENSQTNVIACGGGTVIDAAKIISKGPIICYPTTAAGSACTEHSVIWDGTQKLSIRCDIPNRVIVESSFLSSIPDSVLFETRVDVVSHCFDSLYSKRSCKESENFIFAALEILENVNISTSDLVYAGNLAGKAIQITPTTILHSLSYPLTGRYGVSHGKAMSYFLPQLSDYKNFEYEKYIKGVFKKVPDNIDIKSCLNESSSYSKMRDFKFEQEEDVKSLAKILRLNKI
jgi:alcohol dehydrogenase class IV